MSAAAARDCPRCGTEMKPARAHGLFALFPHGEHSVEDRIEDLLESAQPDAHVCPECGFVELRVQNPTRFS